MEEKLYPPTMQDEPEATEAPTSTMNGDHGGFTSTGLGFTTSAPPPLPTAGGGGAAAASSTVAAPGTLKTPPSKGITKGGSSKKKSGSGSTSSNEKRGHHNSHRRVHVQPKVIIFEPTNNDCLLGRGKSIDQHECNVRFRKILQDHPLLYEYSKSPKDQKRKIAEQMLSVLREEYDIKRFLVEYNNNSILPGASSSGNNNTSNTGAGAVTDGSWIVANDDDVLEKISRTFRRTLKVQKGKQQQQEKNK